MDGHDVMREYRKRYGDLEVQIKTVDKQAMRIKALDGTPFMELPDGTWKACTNESIYGARYIGSVSHGGGIVLKALYVPVDGIWHSTITGDVVKVF